MSSAGLSIKDIINGSGLDQSSHNRGTLERNVEEANKNDCFYNLCNKSSYCGGAVVCGKFKSRKYQIFCFFFTIMCIALFFSIIIPLVSVILSWITFESNFSVSKVLYKIADDGINSEVVIDSTSAVNYDVWKTNTVGKGAEV